MNLEHYTHRLSINTLYYTASLLQLYGTKKILLRNESIGRQRGIMFLQGHSRITIPLQLRQTVRW